jgi:RNA polymerase sigma factor (sigma-70 family)
MTGSHEDAMDLTQDVFLKIWTKLAGFEGRSQLYTWIYRIATNETLGFLQKKKRMFITSLSDESGEEKEVFAAASYQDGKDTEDILLKALANLPLKQRQVFVLRFYDEMPYKQMAEALGTSQGALKASFHHAAKKIETMIKDGIL